MGGVGDSILWPFRKDLCSKQKCKAERKGVKDRSLLRTHPSVPEETKGLSFPSQSESEAKLRSAVGKAPQGQW